MSTACLLAHGRRLGNICDCIAAIALPPSAHSWYEPRPGSGLAETGEVIDQLKPAALPPLLRPGPLDPPAGIALDEARLFWPWGSLYLIDEGDGITRWSFWAAEGRPDAVVQSIKDHADVCCEDAAASLVLNTPQVFLRQDRERFGLDNGDPQGSVGLALLRKQGVVIGWTITGI